MKKTKLIGIALLGLALCAPPALAQSRGGGGRSGGGSSSSRSSSSTSSSRSSGSSFSSSRSSSSSPSRSSATYSSSRSSSSSPSRSNATYSSSRSSSSRSSYTAPSRSSSSSPSRSSATYSSSRSSGSRSSYTAPERRSGEPGRATATPQNPRNTPNGNVRSQGPDRSRAINAPGRPGNTPRPEGPNGGQVRDDGRPTGGPAYGRPGHPGPMPPAHRPIRPAPYFHHPHHHGIIHMHCLLWDPFPPRAWYWPGFWNYCNSYWYDYHVSDVVLVREHVANTYHIDMITYAVSGEYMYALIRDGGNTYFQVYDKNDRLLAEQQVHRKYNQMEIDRENGGCWVLKNNGKDPLLFFYTNGELLIYEAD